jgi:hypothetical protein
VIVGKLTSGPELIMISRAFKTWHLDWMDFG